MIITDLIESPPNFDTHRVNMTVVTNGTLLSDEIADFLNAHDISLGISCDGHPPVHDVFRKYANRQGSSATVEKTIKRVVEKFDVPLVNAVYHPITFRQLPQVVQYFSNLGVRSIYLNPDYSAQWSANDITAIPDVYGEVADLYVDYYLHGQPHFISLIDSKIALILRDGYRANERCRMGKGEFAFTPEGRIYPCERLLEAGTGPTHCIGEVGNDIDIRHVTFLKAAGAKPNVECDTCTLRNYCMNSCGCSNFFATGSYRRVGAFQCTSEKAAINASFMAFQTLESLLGPVFCEHLHGEPARNSVSSKTGI